MQNQTSSQISISFTKIINWTESSGSQPFQLTFYGPDMKLPITPEEAQYENRNSFPISKKGNSQETLIGYGIHGGSTNTMHLNCCFKVRFTQIDHQIIASLKIGEVDIGNFFVDLQLLSNKKIQYLPFDSNQKILQIDLLEKDQQSVGFETSSKTLSQSIKQSIPQTSFGEQFAQVSNLHEHVYREESQKNCPFSRIRLEQDRFNAKREQILRRTRQQLSMGNLTGIQRQWSTAGQSIVQRNFAMKQSERIADGEKLRKSNSDRLTALFKPPAPFSANPQTYDNPRERKPQKKVIDLRSLAVKPKFTSDSSPSEYNTTEPPKIGATYRRAYGSEHF